MRTHYPAPATPAMKESCPLACPAKRSNSAANTDTCCPQSLSSIVCKQARSSKDHECMRTREILGQDRVDGPCPHRALLSTIFQAKWPGQLGSDSHPS